MKATQIEKNYSVVERNYILYRIINKYQLIDFIRTQQPLSNLYSSVIVLIAVHSSLD